jgi:subtilisin-like proprotein convertase family protein/uncharacterized protein YvpB
VHIKSLSSINLFFGVGIVFLLLIFVSLPGFAGTSIESPPVISATYTPTLYMKQISQNPDDQNNPALPEGRDTPSTPNPTILIDYSFPVTDTLTPSPTYTSTPTFTPTPTLTPTETITPQPTIFSMFPFLANQPTYTPTPTPSPPETILFCDNFGDPIPIPDNNANGVNNDISIVDGRLLINLRLYLDISHGAVGDLIVKLAKQNTGETITVLNRPGNPPGSCIENNIVTILDDGAAQPADNKCASYPYAISGIYLPSEALSAFNGMGVSGTWRLNVSDHSIYNTGAINHWCLEAKLSNTMPAPTPTPTPVSLPSSAYVNGMSGQNQQLNLDCESRSAVDWANHFALHIGELEFLNHLPESDDPEAGFVGDPDGTWGLIPPNDYGVHAAPIADLLRDYGAVASSYHSLQWDDLRAEIASGNPVIVWIIGGYSYNLVNGNPHFYTAASTGDTTIVAPWEHTVILVGYTPNSVTILNGSRFVDVPLNQFLDSWSALQFMAVLARP